MQLIARLGIGLGMKKKVYLNNDLRGWGQNIFWELKKLGCIAQVVNDVDEVYDDDDTLLYLNLHHRAERLKKDMLLAQQAYQSFPRVIMIPTLFECKLYNDKIGQYKEFPGGFPPTQYFLDKESAHKAILNMTLPVIIKPNGMAGGFGVKIARNHAGAAQAIEIVFSATSSNGVILQRYLPGNDGDYRVIVLAGRYFWIAKRIVGKNGIVDGESIRQHGIKYYDKLDDTAIEMMDYAHRFFGKHNMTRIALDLIYDKNHNPIMTEFSACWGNMVQSGKWYFREDDGTYKQTQYGGYDQFALMAKLLCDGSFQDVACQQLVERQ